MVSFAQIRYIYNVNSPSTFMLDGKPNEEFGGDEFNLMAKFDNVEFTFNIPFEENYSYIQSKRNSVIAFYDIVLPCQNLRIHMKEKSYPENWANESNTINFDCDKLGVTHNDFQIGSDASKGKYRLISTISTEYTEASFKEDYKVFSPVDRKYGSFNARHFWKSSNKAIILKTLINSFSANDLEGGDEISISVYSDVVDDLFKCGQYHFRSGDAVDLHGLVVPCRDMVTVTLTE